MSRDRIVRDLLERLMESRASVEDVCAEHPELVPEVRDRWQRLQGVRADVDALFPGSSVAGRVAAALADGAAEVPRIDGYTIEGVIGRGGMGVVYRARQDALRRVVAIKMLPNAFASEKEMLRFRREAELVAQLQHPNIVQVHHVGGDGTRPYFVMEYVDGGTLAQRLQQSPMSVRAAVELAVTLADAVAAAHSADIVHRDLKPTNVLLTADGSPKVTDFGLARHVTDDAGLTQSGARLGTPAYMPPEQARGDGTVGPTADVYSLGAILYEMLTGRPPFRADTTDELLRRVMNDDPVRPSRLDARVPRDLETICLLCLHKEPRRRYASSSAFGADLRRYLAHEPIQARPVGAIERAIRWVRRRPSKAAALALAALFGATLIGGAASLVSRDAAIVREVEKDLAEMVRLQRTGAWPAARATLSLARMRLGDGVPRHLRDGIERAGRELALVARLDEIRMARAMAGTADFDVGATGAAYADAFGGASLGAVGGDARAFGAAIAASDIRSALVAALDDWAYCTRDRSRLGWVLEVARHADPDGGWRDRMRNPDTWRHRDALMELAHDPRAPSQSVPLQLILAGLVEMHGADALEIYRRACFANPSDFWANMALGLCLEERQDPDAVAFYRAAQAIRPDAVSPCVNLAISLQTQGDYGESMRQWLKAVQLAPESGFVRANVATAYVNRNFGAEAEQHARYAIEQLPAKTVPPFAYLALGGALRLQARSTEAVPVLERGKALVPAADPLRARLDEELARCHAQLELEQLLPRVLSGDAAAIGAERKVECAVLLGRSKRDAEALPLFVAAFAEMPSLADGSEECCYDAACAAARVVGARAAPPDDAESARLRSLALTWLEARLAEVERPLAGGGGAGRSKVEQALSHWREDADLASVRDPLFVPRLPAAERERCEKLWQRVDTALQDARRAR